jgi:hypothetical protein
VLSPNSAKSTYTLTVGSRLYLAARGCAISKIVYRESKDFIYKTVVLKLLVKVTWFTSKRST